ncbi:hypothetical protein TREMEDRAFT_60936 [Tremella mesenterica DSM 1558]|uniref:uncharacterized protein n=1 Tax=Tremella mesenterica (strain ATCC 24925 / CBS 8224 / DSM 1558 / NBRC 9311 / NRRL Y-6157 / RJB 2259-6 / UBC 559-6) TaxID=578456 RepID=UPI0003F48FC5|nr:uncharacterized protein TREMEDRAFT_60936 [Tremella mesenterica DSM 1558]EIW70442.1 hypothetical protein TREMEDRAFT_60936 [Tremella mesenterica DSM 1558]
MDRFAARPKFQVNRTRLLANLQALQHFHPSYQNVEINHEALAQLPEHGSVFNQLRSTTIEDAGADVSEGPTDQEGEQEDIVVESVVPNVGDGRREIEATRSRMEELVGVDHPVTLTAPPLRATPLYEHDESSQYLVEAFPFLFPQGTADLHAPREHPVTPSQYFKHLMKYDDGRFAAHPQFRYYAFNALLRWQARTLAAFYVSRNPDEQALIAGDIQDLLDSDSIRRRGPRESRTGEVRRAVRRTTAKLAAVHRRSSYPFTTRRITTAKLAVVLRRVPCPSETSTPHYDVVSRGLSTVGQ